jgi:hypothetical protein
MAERIIEHSPGCGYLAALMIDLESPQHVRWSMKLDFFVAITEA